MTESKKICFKATVDGGVSAQSVNVIRKGIVSGANVQQARNQIPKPK